MLSEEDLAAIQGIVQEVVEGSETKLLTAFWNWAQSYEASVRRLTFSDSNTAERLLNLEERISALERKRDS